MNKQEHGNTITSIDRQTNQSRSTKEREREKIRAQTREEENEGEKERAQSEGEKESERDKQKEGRRGWGASGVVDRTDNPIPSPHTPTNTAAI